MLPNPGTSLLVRRDIPGRCPAWFEFWCLFALVVLAVCVLGFALLAGEVVEGETSGFDRMVLLALRNTTDLAQPIGPAWLPDVARDVTGLGGPAVLTFVSVSIAFYLLVVRQCWAAALVVVSVGGGSLLSTALKLAFDRPRPDLVPHAVLVGSASFPSGHAMLAAVTYLTLGGLLMRVQSRLSAKIYVLSLALLLTVLIGISRIYLGVHWPTDVLAGWSGGAAWALFCWLGAVFLQRLPGIR